MEKFGLRKEQPNIYHLVELKDTYDRYVVVLVNERALAFLKSI